MDLSSGVIVAAVVIAALLFYSIRTYNRLVALRNRVRNAWSDIDVQLTRRHDVVPGLVETVKGYLAHERGTLEAATEARSRALAAGANLAARIPAETMLTGAIQRIAVTVERYPELRASQNMQLLQEQLTSTENRIAFAREFYSESVMRLNTAIATFPRNLIAGMMGVGPATLFVADEGTTDDRVIGNRGIENRKLSAAWWSKGRFCGEKSNDRNGTNTNYRVPNTRHRSPNTRPLPPQEKPGLIVLTSSMKTWLCSVLAVEAITLTGNIPRVAVDPAAIVMPN